jgi:hypothetical protein
MDGRSIVLLYMGQYQRKALQAAGCIHLSQKR